MSDQLKKPMFANKSLVHRVGISFAQESEPLLGGNTGGRCTRLPRITSVPQEKCGKHNLCIGNFNCNFIEMIGLKAPGNYPGPFWSNRFSICLWENLKNLSSMISGFLNVSLSPKTNYFIFGDTRRRNKIKKATWRFS